MNNVNNVLTVIGVQPVSDAKLIDMAPPYVLVASRHGWILSNRNDEYIGKALITYGEFSETESQFLQQLLGTTGAVVEVGANIGAHTVPLAKLLAAQGRQLVALEPQPVIFQNLCANLALNGITNVRAWPFACGAASGTVHFQAPDYGAHGNFGGVEFQAGHTATGVSVPCVRLDDTLGDAQISLIKVDVEGFELRVLQGAEQNSPENAADPLCGERPPNGVRRTDRVSLVTGLPDSGGICRCCSTPKIISATLKISTATLSR